MFKIKKRILVFLSITFLINSCGYAPQYGKDKNLDFSLELISISGDRDFNNALKSRLNAYKNNKEKIFKINCKSKYEKNNIKRQFRCTKEYELKITANINIYYEDEQKNFKIVETFKMQNIDDAFEENNYERSIKNNFAEIITEKLVNYAFLMK